MLVIPAIDISAGRVVRLRQGIFTKETVFSDDPVQVAVKWEQAGARRLHVVSLDGARTGKLSDLSLLRDISQAVDIPVQFGGGLRRRADIEAVLEQGASYVVVGTAAINSPELLPGLAKAYGERIYISLDVVSGRVAINGWQTESDTAPEELIEQMQFIGLNQFIYTDIRRDGMLSGPDLVGLRRLLSTGSQVIASGGIASIADIRALARLQLQGAIVGQAVYTEQIKLVEALQAVGGKMDEH